MSASPEIARANGRKSRGHPKGKKNKATLEKEKVQKAVREQILKMANKLIRSQSVAALGTHKMVVINKGEDGMTSVETVRDAKRIDDLLETGIYGEDYLIVAASEPDWKAADALLNRALGKATEHLDHTSDGEKIEGFNYLPPAPTNDQ